MESGQGDSQDGQPGEESTSVPPTGEQDTSSAESEQQGDKDSQGMHRETPNINSSEMGTHSFLMFFHQFFVYFVSLLAFSC